MGPVGQQRGSEDKAHLPAEPWERGARSGPSEVGLKVVGLPKGHFDPREQVPSCPPCQQAARGQGCHTQVRVGLGGQADSEEDTRALPPLDSLAHPGRD